MGTETITARGKDRKGGNWLRVHLGAELDQGGQLFYLTLGVRA